MSIGFATYVSLTSNVLLAVFAAGLAVLVLLQDQRRRSNQYFGLCMATASLYGTFNTVWQVPQQFELEPEPLLQATTTLYIAAIIMLFNFVIAFAGVPHRSRRIEHLVSAPVGVLFILLVWSGRMYTQYEPLAEGSYRYKLTTVGLFGAGTALLYLATSVLVSVRWRAPRARALAVPMGVLAAGVIG
ncbi:MAG: hypothetical protein JW910_07195, partial [Anaerolineae bacterium]|nr:hypothetical protein [Anaerolineae bacterium]